MFSHNENALKNMTYQNSRENTGRLVPHFQPHARNEIFLG